MGTLNEDVCGMSPLQRGLVLESTELAQIEDGAKTIENEIISCSFAQHTIRLH